MELKITAEFILAFSKTILSATGFITAIVGLIQLVRSIFKKRRRRTK